MKIKEVCPYMILKTLEAWKNDYDGPHYIPKNNH